MKRTFYLVVLSILLLLVTGCSTTKPSTVVDGYMKELQNNITTILNEDVEIAEGDESLYNAMVNAMKEFEYEIVEETVNEDSAVVRVRIKTYALGLSFANAITDYLSQALSLAFSGASEETIKNLMFQTWTDKISEEVDKGKNYTETITIELEKIDNKWTIKNDKDEKIFNALTGNLLNIIEKMGE